MPRNAAEPEKTTNDNEEPKVKRRPSIRNKTPKTRTPKPPVAVNPGWTHKAIARAALRAFQDKAQETLGASVDVGELPPLRETDPEHPEATGEEPLELAARIVAHLANRIPGLKRIEKRLEGQERKAGPFSDLLALLTQLYLRNKDQINAAGVAAIRQALEQGKERAAQEKAKRDIARQTQAVIRQQMGVVPGAVPSDHPVGVSPIVRGEGN